MSTFAVLGVLGGGAYAATSFVGSNGQIRGCVHNRTGRLRALRPGKKCSRKEQAISWSQRGPQGPPGAPGRAGAPGEKGEKGDTGQPDTSNFFTKGESDGRFLGIAAKAGDSDRLDNLDSTSFTRGDARIYQATAALTPSASPQNIVTAGSITTGPAIEVSYTCPASPASTNGTLHISNLPYPSLRVFTDNGSANPSYEDLSSAFGGGGGATHNEATAASGEHITVQVQPNTGGVGTLQFFSVHLASDNKCHLQMQYVASAAG